MSDSPIENMNRICIQFSCEDDLLYFISKEADHWWYLSSVSENGYGLCVVNHLEIHGNAKFSKLLNIKGNERIMFGRKLIKSNGDIDYIPFPYKIIELDYK